VVVAIESFVFDANLNHRTVHRGDRVRATDPVVALAPTLFIVDGATSEEVEQARSALAGEPRATWENDTNRPRLYSEFSKCTPTWMASSGQTSWQYPQNTQRNSSIS